MPNKIDLAPVQWRHQPTQLVRGLICFFYARSLALFLFVLSCTKQKIIEALHEMYRSS